MPTYFFGSVSVTYEATTITIARHVC